MHGGPRKEGQLDWDVQESRAMVGEEVGGLAGGRDSHTRWSHLEGLTK